MPFPPLVVTSEIISAAHQNAIRNALITWPGNVSAGGFNLSGVAALSGATGAFSGVVTAASASISGAVTSGSIGSVTGAFTGVVSVAGLLSSASTSLTLTDAINSTMTVTHVHGTVANPVVLSAGGSSSFVFRSNNQDCLVVTGATANFKGAMRNSTLGQYANNAAALAGGLIEGDFYLELSSNPRGIAVVF